MKAVIAEKMVTFATNSDDHAESERNPARLSVV